jgi:hypothetical protein
MEDVLKKMLLCVYLDKKHTLETGAKAIYAAGGDSDFRARG